MANTTKLINDVKYANSNRALKALCIKYGAIINKLEKKYDVQLEQNVESIIGEAVLTYTKSKSKFSTWVWNLCFYKCMKTLREKSRMTDDYKPYREQFEDFQYPDCSVSQRKQLLDSVKKYLHGDIKETIADNLQKLRLGVIQQAVGDVIDKVITTRLKDITDNLNVQLSVSQTVFADELKKATQGINTDIISKLKDSLEDAAKNIESLTSKSGEDKERIFADISDNFNKAVKLAEQRIDGLSGGIFESFGNIKDLFGKGIVDTLDQTLSDILQRLEVSEITTREFWDQAKGQRGFTMKDIWFIRSPEAAKAHINEEILSAKMRVLIVAPNLSDIDIETIKARPSRINFRIAAYIDPTIPEHEAIMQEMDSMDNVDYRNRALQNLWGINKDYEEVILCVLSKTEFRGESVTEIAGIGSIIEEHIKIFVPILEDAWVGARKEVMRTIKKPISLETKPILEEPIKEEPIITKPAITVPSEEPKAVEKEIAEIPKDTFLSKQFHDVLNNLENMTGRDISAALERFQNEYVKREGYNSVLKTIHNAGTEFKDKAEILSRPEREELKLSMKIWKQKLNL